MNISTDLPGFNMTARRKKNFEYMIKHISETCAGVGPRVIIETGSAHDRNNWDGQGQSTLIWDWVVGTYADIGAFSLDIRPESIETAKAQTTNIAYILGDSVKSLADMGDNLIRKTYLLYLDSFDWTPEGNLDSAFHHLAELTSVWRCLPSGCLIVVDDRHGDFKGKHWLVEGYMRQMGIESVFKNHQQGWLKP